MILKHPHPKLNEISEECFWLTTSNYIETLVANLTRELIKVGGQGLSAPQIGKNKRVFVLVINGKTVEFINPQILQKSTETDKEDEYCLSLPGVVIEVERSIQIMLYYCTKHYGVRTEMFEGLTARAIQHEIDHLDGTLIIDYK